MGGCFSSAAKWKDFETEWGKALASEGVSAFHAKDFYALKREFEWYRDAEKDWPRHSAFRDKLTDIIIEYVDEATGFTSDIPLGAGGKAVLRRAYKDSIFKVLNKLLGSPYAVTAHTSYSLGIKILVHS